MEEWLNEIMGWPILDKIAIFILLVFVFFLLSYFVSYLQWRFGAPKYESDNDDDFDNLGI